MLRGSAAAIKKEIYDYYQRNCEGTEQLRFNKIKE